MTAFCLVSIRTVCTETINKFQSLVFLFQVIPWLIWVLPNHPSLELSFIVELWTKKNIFEVSGEILLNTSFVLPVSVWWRRLIQNFWHFYHPLSSSTTFLFLLICSKEKVRKRKKAQLYNLSLFYYSKF